MSSISDSIVFNDLLILLPNATDFHCHSVNGFSCFSKSLKLAGVHHSFFICLNIFNKFGLSYHFSIASDVSLVLQLVLSTQANAIATSKGIFFQLLSNTV
jgi:hypothetical protein